RRARAHRRRSAPAPAAPPGSRRRPRRSIPRPPAAPGTLAAAMNELSRDEIDALLRDQVVGRIGCHADGETYVVPVISAWDGEAVCVAPVEGRKTQTMRANPKVCFEVDEYSGPGVWRSAILQGDYEELAGEDGAHALEPLPARVP